jgi:hypothetical protein
MSELLYLLTSVTSSVFEKRVRWNVTRTKSPGLSER